MKLQLLLIVALVAVASARLPKRLLKRYAMKKVMDSCFGEELVSNIRQEVSAASAKCFGNQAPELAQLRDRLRTRLSAMFAGSDYAAAPHRPASAQFRQAAQFIQVPIQIQPVVVPYTGQGRYKRSLRGKLTVARIQRLRERIPAVVGNVTCVMRELKMLNAENKVDFDSIKQRITAMPVPKELAEDLAEGMDRCREFSACLPESVFEKTPISAGFGKHIAFFKCFKRAKLESCMKQEFREEYLPMLMKADVDGEEGFQSVITSAMLEDEEGDF